MLSLILVTLTAVAAGFAVWAADRHRDRYGALLLPGISVGAAVLTWTALQAAGAASFESDWIGWVIPAAVAILAPLVAVVPIGNSRAKADTAESERILRM
ncbi:MULTISPECIES: poly-gamma-glutamate biosynthesis protein PgsC/CapC [unclassified Arthrobacter]|uniref:poly-gamma-glutamate biosynthesis protein PgsC/CapC n=1 Tax=unclassified Arthrobacter TaxID=235627 RepID=UPI001E5A44CE|nr:MULTISPECIES: poly-gamma-glutamate biosynthesis protein PgsC/CapC [unclassified Arthrobacter]MCC9146392.1 poly-gamma-glutamate biosynthesis protein PgsC/CapC [Arthrobacter sp. zg-Y919]MDK1277622.1 poly-gamma-glutamate biosynthesis protein PgsC/CapC [Arthrobacter sp. zg.Y919]WIB02416.1 poly-gamma-glutamate biosynthesis protein PgsC/CapC [Arthrobacter sp. zg-Y919]